MGWNLCSDFLFSFKMPFGLENKPLNLERLQNAYKKRTDFQSHHPCQKEVCVIHLSALGMDDL